MNGSRLGVFVWDQFFLFVFSDSGSEKYSERNALFCTQSAGEERLQINK